MRPADCTHKGCTKLARWRVGFRLWAKGHPKNHVPLEGFLQQYVVCDEHCTGIKVEDLLLPEGRARIEAAMLAMGKAAPDFDGAELAFQDLLDEPEAIPNPRGRMH